MLRTLAASGEPPPLEGGGSGRSLPEPLLATAAACSVFATVLSIYSIVLQLRAYYKPTLQRYTVRILVMVPIYAVASVTSLFSLRSAFVVDVLRDLYEAVTLLSLFNLMIAYLGGERSILVLAHSREPVSHPWPVRLFYPPLDMSNPHTFLSLKRGVLQYVQIKPVLAIATIATKLTGTYHEGKLGLNYYTLEQIIYNFSVFLSLYCLAMFWSCLSPDLASFRVTPKFICIKGIIFFSFWQGLAVSIVVALGLVTRIGPVADPQYLSIAITDILICLEMPFFAIGHLYAFSPRDYIETASYYQARLPAKYALRDSIGVYDMMSDAVDTIKGGMRHRYSGLSSPADEELDDETERKAHAAGMRYTGEGSRRGAAGHARQRQAQDTWASRTASFIYAPISGIKSWARQRRMAREGYSPLLGDADQEGSTRDLEQGSKDSLGRKHADYSSDEDEDDSEDEDEITARLRKLAKEGVVGTLDFLTGHRFKNDHADDASTVSCHFSLHEHESGENGEASTAGAPSLRLDDTEPIYDEARALTREDVCFPGARTGQQEEMLRKWIVEQEANLRAAAQAREREQGTESGGPIAAAASSAISVLPWAKRRRQREEELIGRMRMIREKKAARREARRRDRSQRKQRGGQQSGPISRDETGDRSGGGGPSTPAADGLPSPTPPQTIGTTPPVDAKRVAKAERRAAKDERRGAKKGKGKGSSSESSHAAAGPPSTH